MLQLLATEADAGVHIRILRGDSEPPAIAQRGQDERIGDSAAARIRNVEAPTKPLIAHDRIMHRPLAKLSALA